AGRSGVSRSWADSRGNGRAGIIPAPIRRYQPSLVTNGFRRSGAEAFEELPQRLHVALDHRGFPADRLRIVVGLVGQAGDLADALVDVVGHLALLLGGAGDLQVQRVDRVHRLDDAVQRGAGLADMLQVLPRLPGALAHARPGAVHAFLQALDDGTDLAGGGLGAAGQGTHLVGDHREAASGLAG